MNQKTNDSEIAILVDGKKLTGKISYLSLKDISMEMIYPFPGIKRGLHIPHFDYKKTFNENNIEEYAKMLLTEIYSNQVKIY